MRKRAPPRPRSRAMARNKKGKTEDRETRAGEESQKEDSKARAADIEGDQKKQGRATGKATKNARAAYIEGDEKKKGRAPDKKTKNTQQRTADKKI